LFCFSFVVYRDKYSLSLYIIIKLKFLKSKIYNGFEVKAKQKSNPD